MADALNQVAALAAQGVGRLQAEALLGRPLTDAETQAFRSAAAARRLRLAAKKARGPMSVAERVRKHVAAANDVGAFDHRPRHPLVKELCRRDLALFGWIYCRQILRHKPSKEIREGLVKDVQDMILNGGKAVKMYGRGTGKTTWIAHIAPVWAVLYGHRRYIVEIAATAKLAKKNLKTVKRLLSRSPRLAADFPEVVVPVRAIGDVSQRSASQTYQGTPTDIEWAADQIVLPMLRGDDGEPLGAGCGAVIGSVGIGGAVRGANEGGQRPDFLVFDDPQTKKIAHSPALTEDVIAYIHQDALQLAGHDRVLSAFVTITPQCYGDVATELTSQSKHPEWSVTVEPFVSRKCPKWDELLIAFVREYVEDAVNHDYRFSRSRAWYLANREAFSEVRVIDPLQFDPKAEVDAVHHVLNLRASLGETAFNAEIMMEVADVDSELSITADKVAAAVNGAPRGVCPPGTDTAVAFCDVNIMRGRGLSWAVCAFGPGRVAAVVAYGRYPERGALVAPNASDLARNRAVAAGIRAVTETIASLRLRDAKGRKMSVRALGFDRGYLPSVVHRALYVIRKTRPLPFNLVAVRGFPWNKFGTRAKDMLRRGDHVFATRSQYGEYLAEMAPYWREVMQSGFLETPLMPGSLSLYGNEPSRHFEFASEVCAEKLVRKYVVESRGKSETAWDWVATGENHYCDVLTGCFAVASWFHCYDALSSVLDAAAAGAFEQKIVNGKVVRVFKAARREAHQDDLFDPRRNPAVVEAANYDAVSDETEGTGEELPPLPGETDNPTDPLLSAEGGVRSAELGGRARRPDAPIVPLRPPPSALRPPHSALRTLLFKRGRYRK